MPKLARVFRPTKANVTATRELNLQDYPDAAILCIVSKLMQTLQARVAPKTYRANRMTLAIKELERVEATFVGSMDDGFIEDAEKLNKSIELALAALINKHMEVSHDGAVQQTETAGSSDGDGCGEVLQGE